MRDYISIGSSPSNESCVNVGEENYHERARAECNRFIKRIREKLGPEPFGAELRVKFFPHDFGDYAEVICYYDDNEEAAVDYAFKCESEAPETWGD